MPKLLTVSRAARLVGVSRGAVQKKIQDGELPTFEGQVTPVDLLRVFPDTELKPDREFERVTSIKAHAYGKRVAERTMPDPEILSARLQEVGGELADAKVALKHYRTVFQQLQDQLDQISHSTAQTRGELASQLRKWLSKALDQSQSDIRPIQPLLLQDSMLTVMSAHVHLQPSGHEFFVEGKDSILEAALTAGLSLDYRCSNGNCGACKARIISGDVKKIKNHDYVITEAEKGMGYALLCCHTAVTDLVVEAREASGAGDIPEQEIPAKVKGIERLTEDMIQLSLQTPRTLRMRFLAGQLAELRAGDARKSYHMASCPCDDRNIQFYVRKETGNAFSDYVFGKLKKSEVVNIRGPFGDYILNEDSPRSIVFIAWDDGFSPINSLIEHAMALEIAERMHLYWIVSKDKQHYRDNQCRAWADALDNFSYEPLVAGSHARDALNHVFRQHRQLEDYDIYIAGPEAAVTGARQILDNRAFPAAQVFGYVVE
ncbi:MAG: 2Fe-2S iron-sulfur cluster-binding protein [Gammaproteobacteria bacterium]|nr:2Fe-2S iron-sulfur cluster-binding protein [Gammaproteobacteria bacterium]